MAGEVWAWEVHFKWREASQDPGLVPEQVSHPGSWILENCALSFFARLFFEVAEMKALQAVATPHRRSGWQPTRSKQGGCHCPGVEVGVGGVAMGAGSPLCLPCRGKPQILLPSRRPQFEDGWVVLVWPGALVISESAFKPLCLPKPTLVAQCTWIRGSPAWGWAPHYPGVFGDESACC